MCCQHDLECRSLQESLASAISHGGTGANLLLPVAQSPLNRLLLAALSRCAIAAADLPTMVGDSAQAEPRSGPTLARVLQNILKAMGPGVHRRLLRVVRRLNCNLTTPALGGNANGRNTKENFERNGPELETCLSATAREMLCGNRSAFTGFEAGNSNTTGATNVFSATVGYLNTTGQKCLQRLPGGIQKHHWLQCLQRLRWYIGTPVQITSSTAPGGL
jgi:hypothetical protein